MRRAKLVSWGRTVEDRLARTPRNFTYGGQYFGEGRKRDGDREGQSGYATYDRVSSNADIAAALLNRNFRFTTCLDVGCATGFLVEALREHGKDAIGVDVSSYAVAHPAPGAVGFLKKGDLVKGLRTKSASYDLISTLEILEHLPPKAVPKALLELRRLSKGVVVATIPSFGKNSPGPNGHFEGKVKDEALARYNEMPETYEGPVPFDDLMRDATGLPIEGHLTIASYSWWTKRFEEAGFIRMSEVEKDLYADISPARLGPFWNLYVMKASDAKDEVVERKNPTKSLRELGLLHPLTEHYAQIDGLI